MRQSFVVWTTISYRVVGLVPDGVCAHTEVSVGAYQFETSLASA